MNGLTLTAIIVLVVNTSVTGYIGYLYAKKLQDNKFKEDYRLKAAIVAEMFSIWCQGPHSKTDLTPQDFQKLNKLIWECTFWLPDNIIADINLRLQNDTNSKDLKEILVEVREYLNPNLEHIDWQKITHF